MLVGAAALLKAAVLAPVLIELRQSEALRFPMASWLPALPGEALVPAFVVWVAAALAFLIGWRTRWAGLALTAVLVAVLLGDQQLYSNHLYLLVTLVGVFTLMAGEWVARPILLLRLQPTIVYGFAAVTKLTVPYLSGAVLNVYIGDNSIIPFPESLRTAQVMASLALLSIAVEIVLALGLWSSRWCEATIILGVFFHVGIVVMLDTPVDLTVFALLMFALYVVHAERPVRA